MTATVTAAEGSKNFDARQGEAVREPLIIIKNGRSPTVLMAYEDLFECLGGVARGPCRADRSFGAAKCR